MSSRFRLAAVGTLSLAACTAGPSTPDGAVVLDEEVTLAREAKADSARREMGVAGDSIIVAFVDEKLTDVSIRIEMIGSNKDPISPVDVENNLAGSGVEIAVLEVPDDSRIVLTLTGPPNATAPGRVKLRLRRFAAPVQRSKFAAQVAAFKAWTSATNASHGPDAIKKSGLADMDRAIAHLEGPQGDAGLAAEARLIKANMLSNMPVHWHESRAEAQRAAKAFAALPDALNVARARFIEASVLGYISLDSALDKPTAAAWNRQARSTLVELSGAASAFGPIERARAIEALAAMDKNQALLDEANQRYEEAKALYHAAGYAAGEREMLANLAHMRVERGQFYEAAKLYDGLLPELRKISNPEKRATVLVSAGRAQARAGRTDEAIETLLKALTESREFKLIVPQASALQELGLLYSNRGDYPQAQAFLSKALMIARDFRDDAGIATMLGSAGMIARNDGDVATAIKMHEEAVQRASFPIMRVRSMRQLALDHAAAGDFAQATAQLRGALAVKLQDPRHHAYSDIKFELAEMLIEHGDGSSTSFKEAAALLGESLQMCLEMHDKPCEIGVFRVKARLLAKQGKVASAQAEFERALELIFEYRKSTANPQLRAQAIDHEQPAFRGYFDLVMRNAVSGGPARLRRASATEEGALRMLERARESHFGARHLGPMDAATTARVDALLAQMANKSLEIATLLKRTPTPPETARLEALHLDMSNLRAEIDRERTAAAESQSVAGESSGGTALAWRNINPNTVQISYALGNEHAYAWVRTAKGTRVAMLSEDPATLERELTELASLDPQRSAEKVERSIAHVSSVLLPPGILPDDSNALEIVAEGRIASVPFAGLRSPRDSAHRLVETHSITMITSMFAVEEPPRPKQTRPFRLVALASGSDALRSAPVVDPVPKLGAATAEIRAVADLFVARDKSAKIKLLTGREGNATALRGFWSSGADVVHFATHARADLRQPLASLLVLPAKDAAGTPTYLTAGQVQEWRGDANLVFLSACESAIGPPRFAGGMPGLQSAFLRAGARGVIATLWPIEDVLASEFSSDFYRAYIGGQSAAQALGETQRAWLAADLGVANDAQLRRRITALAHGFYER
jgi:CHAT domain-containing protein/tetratricopeptide (TPR) repeat protein